MSWYKQSIWDFFIVTLKCRNQSVFDQVLQKGKTPRNSCGVWRVFPIMWVYLLSPCLVCLVSSQTVETQRQFFPFVNLISEWLKSGMFPLSSVLQSNPSLPWLKKHQEKSRQVLKWLMVDSNRRYHIFSGVTMSWLRVQAMGPGWWPKLVTGWSHHKLGS